MSESAPQRSLRWPIIGSAIFFVLVPGSVVGLVPFLLSGWRVRAAFFGWAPIRWFGVALFFGALPIFIDFFVRFVRDGRGTPAPIAPTERLVVSGPFRYVRNPGYVCVVSMLIGQGLFFGNAAILIYAAVVAVAFHLFVLFYEEPTLRRQFGAEYLAYCRRVPRWIPRRTGADLPPR